MVESITDRGILILTDFLRAAHWSLLAAAAVAVNVVVVENKVWRQRLKGTKVLDFYVWMQRKI